MPDADRSGRLDLRLVDGRTLPRALRALLRAGDVLRDAEGRAHRLPRYFYEVPSWERAVALQLTPHFALYEFVSVDVREAALVRTWPRYVPCAVTLLAVHLELLRRDLGAPLYLAANGGYRSPGHALDSRPRWSGDAPVASPHHWGTAANVYRIGDDWLDTEGAVERYRERTHALLPGVWTRPFGDTAGFTDDHLHLDLGFAVVTPHEADADDAPPDDTLPDDDA